MPSYNRYFGSPFAGGAAMGVALADAAESQESFARTIENNKVILQKRALDLQAASLSMQNRRQDAQDKLAEKQILVDREKIAAELEGHRIDRSLSAQNNAFDQKYKALTGLRADQQLVETQRQNALNGARDDAKLALDQEKFAASSDAAGNKISPQDAEMFNNVDGIMTNKIALSKEAMDNRDKVKLTLAAAQDKYDRSLPAVGQTQTESQKKATALAKANVDSLGKDLASLNQNPAGTAVEMLSTYKAAMTKDPALRSASLVAAFKDVDWSTSSFDTGVKQPTGENKIASPDETRAFAKALMLGGKSRALAELLGNIQKYEIKRTAKASP